MTLTGLQVPDEEPAEMAAVALPPQPASMDLTNLKEFYPFWYGITVDGHDVLLDLCLQHAYGAWMDRADRQALYLMGRNVLSEVRRLYLDVQLARPAAEQDLPESSTFSIFSRSFKQ